MDFSCRKTNIVIYYYILIYKSFHRVVQILKRLLLLKFQKNFI